jgi:hypothetical protein
MQKACGETLRIRKEQATPGEWLTLLLQHKCATQEKPDQRTEAGNKNTIMLFIVILQIAGYSCTTINGTWL